MVNRCGADTTIEPAAPDGEHGFALIQDIDQDGRIDAADIALTLSLTGGETMKWLASICVFNVFAGQAIGQVTCGTDLESCYEEHEAPGCFQPDCCELVCLDDVFCCTDSWDEICVELAEGLCNDVLCPNYGKCDRFLPSRVRTRIAASTSASTFCAGASGTKSVCRRPKRGADWTV